MIPAPDGQYFFGLFGSTRKQREAADKLANDNSGDVMDRSKRGISAPLARVCNACSLHRLLATFTHAIFVNACQ